MTEPDRASLTETDRLGPLIPGLGDATPTPVVEPAPNPGVPGHAETPTLTDFAHAARAGLTSLGHEHLAATRILATAELEHLLCNPRGADTFSKIQLPAQDSWSVRFPDLTSLAFNRNETRPLSVCIATEDIVGPVRNGGIGTTYAALAKMLAAEGHHTTILYLRGREIETGTLEQWVEHYAAMNVNFVPVPNYAARDGFRSSADRWLRAPYNMFRYLVEHPTDVVHVSEWRGSGYLSLLAKRQGIAFRDTLFVVKTSSPWMWNRMYGSQPLERLEDAIKVFAERRSVELADVVIGGSLHLIRWMLSQGYDVPRERTFVQPNVVEFDHLKPFMGGRNFPPATRMPVEELVFFGRLEARKGLFTFVKAIERLIRQGVTLPKKISFMGKPGAKLTARPNQTILEYIHAETASWPCEIQVHTEFQQTQAIEYLLSGNRLAVMPSTIENSSLAVYEAAICGIPFVASDVGGTPELIETEDHSHVLCAPHPIPLAARIADALDKGAYIASASFDNDENLAVWKDFHANLGGGLRDRLLSARSPNQSGSADWRIGVCIYYTGEIAALDRTLASLETQRLPADEILIAVDAVDANASAAVLDLLATRKLPCRVIETFDFDVGLSFNALAEAATATLLMFLWEGTTLTDEALEALKRIATLSGADVLNFFYRESDPARPEEPSVLKVNVVGSLTEAFFRADLSVQPILVRRDAFLGIGGFTTDMRVLGYDQEFISKAQLSGLHCETALVELADVQQLQQSWLEERCYDQPTSYFRAIRPQLATVPLALRDFLLMAKGLSAAGNLRAKRQAPKVAEKPRVVTPSADTNLSRVLRSVSGQGVPVLKAPPATRGPKPGSVDNIMRLLEATEDRPNRDPTEKKPAEKKPPGNEKKSPEKKTFEKKVSLPAVQPVKRRPAPVPASDPTAGRDRTPKESPFEGRLLYVRDGIASGWVFHKAEPDLILSVEAVSDGRVLATASASNGTVDLGSFGKPGITNHAFALPVFTGWSGFSLRSIAVDLRVQGSEVLVAKDVRVFTPVTLISNSPFQGYCEASSDGVVTGWVWMPEDPDRRLDVDVFVDKHFVGRAHADLFRDDVRAAGFATGEYGFRLALAQRYLNEEGAHLTVVVARAGVPLGGSPLLIRRRRLESLPDRLHRPAARLMNHIGRVVGPRRPR